MASCTKTHWVSKYSRSHRQQTLPEAESAAFTVTLTPTITNTPTATVPPVPVFAEAHFTYDADGARVKSVLSTDFTSTTAHFVGNHYELSDGIATKYYGVYPEPCRGAGSQRIAMRKNGTVNYLIGDHLGSASLTTDANGTLASEMKYKAWGEVRFRCGSTETNYTYTGQYSYTNDFGLMYYNARWYDPYLNQFTQLDTMVLDPYNPQDWNRYANLRNSPVHYNYPTGHCMFGLDTAVCDRCVDNDPYNNPSTTCFTRKIWSIVFIPAHAGTSVHKRPVGVLLLSLPDTKNVSPAPYSIELTYI